MLKSKQREQLLKLSNGLQATVIIGKNGVTPQVITSIEDCLRANELVKCSVLDTCDKQPKEVALYIEKKLKVDIVRIIGKKVILYKKNPKKKGRT